MTLVTNDSHHITDLKTSKMQTVIISNRLILGLTAFSISFGLSLVPTWDITKAFFTGLITVIATYSAALFVDKRHKNHELLVLSSLHRRIREREGLKSRLIREIEQLQDHNKLLYIESQQLQNQILECRNQRDTLHRELGNFAGQKKQLESEISILRTEFNTLEITTAELNDYYTNLTADKRRLELNYNASRAEIIQLETQIEQLQQQQQEIQNNLTLLGRLKPQLEEKMYELRIEIQELEVESINQNQLLTATRTARENLEHSFNSLQTQTTAQKIELTQLQNQISLLHNERDSLQNQVWELLQQVENFNPDPLLDNPQDNNIELFPFDELLEPLEPRGYQLPPEWNKFLTNLSAYQIQILKAIIDQNNTKATIKKIAEANITMPNLLIDSINEKANDIIGELIIETNLEIPEIAQEHTHNLKKMLAMYEENTSKTISAN